jgi:hypothetical protein
VKLDEVLKLAKYAKVDNAKRFAQHVVPEVVRPAQVIWNQAIGALFILLAAMPLPKVVQSIRDMQHDSANGFVLALSLVFFSVMLFFGLMSFAKARRIAGRIPRP